MRHLLLILLLCSCSKLYFGPVTELFIIEKGKHYSNNQRIVSIIKPLQLLATVKFDSTCIYKIEAKDQADWNKLFGLSFYSKPLKVENPVHVDSARWAWRYNADEDVIEISAYNYVDEICKKDFCIYKLKSLDSIQLEIRIDYIEKQYIYLINNEVVCRESFRHQKFKAKLEQPYFGGNQVAPKTIQILLELKII